MVISTGITWPRMFSVAWLYCLQNSIVCTPCGPSAVPTGGAGVACPAGSWIFTIAVTRLRAIALLFSRYLPSLVHLALELRDLAELELDRRLASKDIDQHFQLEL